jgi:TonB-dependent SusC/RagA subfamily outer membrane receptor
MKIRILKPAIYLTLIFLMVLGCTSTEKAVKTGETNRSTQSVLSVDQQSISLADYLRRISSINVQGSGDNTSVTIRGVQSISGSNQPLFIINNQQVGRNFSVVNASVDVNDIDHIQVIKGSEAGSRYGLRGGSGVIIIKTKSSKTSKGTTVEELLKKFDRDSTEANG